MNDLIYNDIIYYCIYCIAGISWLYLIFFMFILLPILKINGFIFSLNDDYIKFSKSIDQQFENILKDEQIKYEKI